MLEKYALLLVDYSLYLTKGDKLYIKSTTLAAPLIKEIYKLALLRGAIVIVDMSFEGQGELLLKHGEEEQLTYVNPIYKEAMTEYDAYLFIRAPFSLKSSNSDVSKQKLYREARKPFTQAYYKRNGNGEMRRSLCQYPTQASADMASMTLEEYSKFVFDACKLYDDNPKESWISLSKMQEKVVDKLHTFSKIRYVNKNSDISFSTEGRTWINSDGKTNMPSGEVYTSPVEDSVNGHIVFNYPTRYLGNDVEDIELKVKNGIVVEWKAKKGQETLDKVFSMKGAKVFGEAAIGTNYNITKATKNILFDEKIGGTIHMAVGQSYPQAGGKNESSVHWDLICGMKDGGRIYGDNELIYEDGRFIFA